jgi:hypothetical protein
MKTSLLNSSKRKFFLTGALALASMKLGSFMGAERASAKEASSKSVEDRIASLEHEVMRLQAINEIENLMGRYEAIHMGQYVQKTWELYARHTPNTWMDIADWGVFVGIDSIKRAWNQGTIGVVGPVKIEGSGGQQPPQPGQAAPAAGSGQTGASNQPPMGLGKTLAEHPLTTPVIQIARDGKTAKAIWWSPGMERGGWAYGKYAVDFVKEDGAWRIWHLKWFRIFITPYNQSYTESQDPVETANLINLSDTISLSTAISGRESLSRLLPSHLIRGQQRTKTGCSALMKTGVTARYSAFLNHKRKA